MTLLKMTECICAKIYILLIGKVLVVVTLKQGGGNPSFIEYTKHFIDALNAYHATKADDLEVNDFTNSAYSITYYDSIIVIEKRKRDTRSIAGAVIGDNKFW